MEDIEIVVNIGFDIEKDWHYFDRCLALTRHHRVAVPDLALLMGFGSFVFGSKIHLQYLYFKLSITAAGLRIRIRLFWPYSVRGDPGLGPESLYNISITNFLSQFKGCGSGSGSFGRIRFVGIRFQNPFLSQQQGCGSGSFDRIQWVGIRVRIQKPFEISLLIKDITSITKTILPIIIILYL